MGVQYIKISRFDLSGSDHSISLQELDVLKIIYTDIGPVNYNILEVSEYPTYYLYKVSNVETTSSINTILDYKFRGTTSSFSSTGTGRVNLSPIIDAQGAFSQLSDKYIFPNSPSFPLYLTYTSSINTVAGATSTSIAITTQFGDSLNEIDLHSASFAPGISSSISLNYSGTFDTNQQVYITYRSANGFTINNAIFNITQSVATGSNIAQVILEPYISSPFYNSDNNVLVNNVFANSKNRKYMDVDYSTNYIFPTNLTLILSGTADMAEVKPYYYSLLRHIRPRYLGSRNQSAYVNFYSSPNNNFNFANGDTGSYEGDNGYGFLPNVYLLNSNIIEFKWGRSSEPEMPGCSNFELGNIIEVYSASQNTASINILSLNNSDYERYHYAISSSLFPNYRGFNFIQYGTPVPINYTKVVTTNFGVPQKSTWWIPTNVAVSGSLNSYATWNHTYNAFQWTFFKEVLSSGKDGEKQYIAGESVGNLIANSQEFNLFTQSLINGERWFMTISNKINSPLTGSIIPWNYGYSTTSSHDYKLENIGVYQIVSASGPLPQLVFFKNPLLDPYGNTITSSIYFGPNQGFNSGGLGALLWKATTTVPPAKPNTRYLIMEGSTPGLIGKGAIIQPNSTFDINQHFNYILKTFGEK